MIGNNRHKYGMHVGTSDQFSVSSGRLNRIPNLFGIIRYSVRFGIFGENRTEYLQGKTELLIVLRRVFRGKN